MKHCDFKFREKSMRNYYLFVVLSVIFFINFGSIVGSETKTVTDEKLNKMLIKNEFNKAGSLNQNLNRKFSTSTTNSFKANTSAKLQILMKIAMNLKDTKHINVKNKSDPQKLKNLQDVVVSGSIIFNKNTHELTFINQFLEENSDYTNSNKVLIARGKYSKTLNTTGWSKLFLETFNNAASEILNFAAGYIEGKLTAKNILEFYKNLVGIHAEEEDELADVYKYYADVEQSIRQKTTKQNLKQIINEDELQYWMTVALVQAQTDGLYAGYITEMKEVDPLSFEKMYFINADGEVPELMTLFKTKRESKNAENNENNNGINIDNKFSFKQSESKSSSNLDGTNYKEKSILLKKLDKNMNTKINKIKSKKPEKKPKQLEKFSKEYLLKYFGESDPTLLWEKLMMKSHCSALIKSLVNPKGYLEDVFVSHTTWDSYSEMHRIFKVYDFKYDLFGKEKHSKIIFSSYPGTLTSTDDFYMLNSKISILETTLEILDRDLYMKASVSADGHVPNYIRISVANRIANTGKHWTELFKQNNSGTYNSQWMILDFGVLNEVNALASKIDNNNYDYSNSNNSNSVFGNDVQKYLNAAPTSGSIFSTQLFSAKGNHDNYNNDDNYAQNPLGNTRQLFDNYNGDYYRFKEKIQKKMFNANAKNLSTKSKNKGSANININNQEIMSKLNGFFYVLEQIPGYIHIEDQTKFLFKTSFWASYNRPFYESIYTKSGYAEMMKKYGLIYSYYDNPRAKLFNAKVTNIESIEDIKEIMQSSRDLNGRININSISPRFDLSEDNRLKKASGGIDTKITSFNMISKDEIVIKSGPSTSHHQAPFSWDNFNSDPHYGLPRFWNFPWHTLDYNSIRNK